MAENVFEAVKQSVSTREAAAFYGIEVKRNGMACCPFHDDKNPSMKVDQRFHCFGCGADGDVIDFTAKLFDLSPKEAAEKLAQDFGLIYDSRVPPRRRYVRQKKRGTEGFSLLLVNPDNAELYKVTSLSVNIEDDEPKAKKALFLSAETVTRQKTEMPLLQ